MTKVSEQPQFKERLQRLLKTVPYRILGFKIVKAEKGSSIVEAEVGPDTTNPGGTLHGGVMAFLVDEAGTLAIATADAEGRPGVTTDLNLTCIKAVPEGRVYAHGQVLRTGRTMAYVSVDIKSGSGELLAQGRMSKFLK